MLELTKKPRTKAYKKIKKNDPNHIPWRDLLGGGADSEIPSTVLRGARVKEGLTQNQLSATAGIPQGHISAMENGKREIGKIIAQKLGKALNINYKV